MPMDKEKVLLHCYNLGCGQKYDPEENKEDSCIHHPGTPFFHDAYKGWSCCKKKCTDFTEFLNVKGCKKSFHSNVKPQVEKPIVDKSKAHEVIEYKAPQPMVQQSLKRPPVDSPMVDLKPAITAPSLKQSGSVEVAATSPELHVGQNELQIGMPCKNKGCKKTYEGEDSKYEDCTYHPGVPIFHEGLKFWSCCTRRTSDFNAFLEQQGCNVGKHKWFEDKNNGDNGNGSNGSSKLQYRYDWHQTGTHVVVAVYAKSYDPVRTTVKLNPVRLIISVQDTATAKTFDLDIHLRGVVDVDSSSSSFLATKIEVKMRKAEPGSWVDIALPRKPVEDKSSKGEIKSESKSMEGLVEEVECVDLSDL